MQEELQVSSELDRFEISAATEEVGVENLDQQVGNEGLASDLGIEVLGAILFFLLCTFLGLVFRRPIAKLSNPRFQERKNHFIELRKKTTEPANLKRSELLIPENPEIFGVIEKKAGPLRIVGQKTKSMNRRLSKYIQDCIIPYKLEIDSAHFKGADAKQVIQCHASRVAFEVILPALNSAASEVIFVEGKVGSGKTTLLLSIAQELQKVNEHSQRQAQTHVLPIYLDVRKALSEFFEKDDDFNRHIHDPNIQTKVFQRIQEEIFRLLVKSGVPPNTHDFQAGLKYCLDNNIRVAVILDELDYLYYDFARRIISFEGIPSSEFIKTYSDLFIRLLSLKHESPEKGLGGSIVYVLSARSSTLNLFSEVAARTGHRIFHRIKVHFHTNADICKILSNNLKFISLSNNVTSEARQNIAELIDVLNSGALDFTKNIKVSVHGLRHIINLLSRMAAQDSSFALANQVIRKPGLFRLYQYIDGSPEYSQANEGISNVFLVNSQAPYSKRMTMNPKQIENYDKRLLLPHLQTYWMKYLILMYLEHHAKKNDDSMPFDDILEVFSPVGSEKKTHYEDSVVRLALIHASGVDHGRLIKFGHDSYLSVMPTTRFLELYRNWIFWEFGYLMVVIEDGWQYFPLDVINEFSVSGNGYQVYEFITGYHLATDADKYRFVESKARQVLVFFELLRVSFEYESQRYSVVFERLRAAGIDIDFMDFAYDKLKASVVEFTRTFVSEEYGEKIRSFVLKYEEQDRKCVQKKLKRAFRKYHQRPSLRSVAWMMSDYHEFVVKKYGDHFYIRR